MKSLIIDIWASFRALPLWVQLWVSLLLMPVNFASLMFLSAEGGGMIAFLAVGGMIPNAPILLWERGFSKLLAVPHILFWMPLLFIIILRLIGGIDQGSDFYTYLVILFITNTISIVFDLFDTWSWIRGERNVAGV